MTAYPVLTVVTFLPLVGAALVLFPIGKNGSERRARWIALATAFLTLAASAPLYLNFDKTSSATDWDENEKGLDAFTPNGSQVCCASPEIGCRGEIEIRLGGTYVIVTTLDVRAR